MRLSIESRRGAIDIRGEVILCPSFLGKSNNVHLLGVGLVIFPQKVCILKLFIDCKNGNASLVRQTRYKITPKMNAMGSSLPVLCIKVRNQIA